MLLQLNNSSGKFESVRIFCKQMAKFYFEKDRSRNSQESRNPWSTSSTYIDVGCFRNLISLTERSGLCLTDPTGKERSKVQDEIRESARKKSNFTKQLEILAELENALPKAKEIIHHHHLVQETKDLTDPSILDAKTKKMEELTLHFSAIVDKKEELIHRLQQPFVGDYISIDADYKRYVVDAIPYLASILSNLTTLMENLTWSTQLSLENGEMEKILANISSILALMQSYFQSLCISRNLMSKILNDVRTSTDK